MNAMKPDSAFTGLMPLPTWQMPKAFRGSRLSCCCHNSQHPTVQHDLAHHTRTSAEAPLPLPSACRSCDTSPFSLFSTQGPRTSRRGHAAEHIHVHIPAPAARPPASSKSSGPAHLRGWRCCRGACTSTCMPCCSSASSCWGAHTHSPRNQRASRPFSGPWRLTSPASSRSAPAGHPAGLRSIPQRL